MFKKSLLMMMSLWMTVLLLAPSSISAHSMPSSVVNLDFLESEVATELIIPLDRLEVAFGENLYDDPEQAIETYPNELVSYITSHISAETDNGEQWSVVFNDLSLAYPDSETESIDLVVHLTMAPPANAAVDAFTLNYDVVVRELVTHVVTVEVASDWNNGIYSSEPEIIASIIDGNTTVDIDRSEGSVWTGFVSIIKTGMAHIAEGADHLLFLLVLLLPVSLLVNDARWGKAAGLKASVNKLLKITLAFTIGHSITLIIGTTGWVSIPSQPIEILIAVSILISAIHAVVPVFSGREVYVAGGFGLVHGLAFAALVTDLGVTPMRIVMSILGFNIGIEIMQLIVIALIMPWFLLLSATRAYTPVRITGAVFAVFASVGWILDRGFSVGSPVDAIVNSLADNVLWLVAVLAVLSVSSIVLSKVSSRRPVRSEL